MPGCRGRSSFEASGSFNQMPKRSPASFSVARLPATLLDDPVGHLVKNLWGLKREPAAFRSHARFGARGWNGEKVWPV
jgi:hypothetical protein